VVPPAGGGGIHTVILFKAGMPKCPETEEELRKARIEQEVLRSTLNVIEGGGDGDLLV